MPEKERKPSSFNENDKVEEVLNKISELNVSEMSRFLRKFVKRTCTRNPSEMDFLRSLVQAVPLGSNLDRLPFELLSQVLRNLNAKTLGKLSGTCRRLCGIISNDPQPWKSVFERDIEAGKISEVTKTFQNQLTQTIKNSKAICSPNFAYTSAFLYEMRLKRNWQKVLPSEKPVGFECHASHVVTCMEVDPKGRFILTGSDDSTVRLWCVANQREIGIFSGHLGGVWALKVDWDRGILITGSTDRTLIIWDLNSGERLKHLLGHTSTVRCAELHEDLVISGSRDGTLRVWSLITGDCIHVLQGHTASVRCLSLGPESGTIVSGSYDHTCRLWSLERGECLRVFQGHTNKVYSVTSTRDQIFSGSLDGTVRVWSAASEACLKKFEGHRSLVGLVQSNEKILRDVIVSGSTDGSLQIIKRVSENSYESSLLPAAHPSSITSLDFNRNFLVTGSEGVVRLWSLDTPSGSACEDSSGSSCRLLANLIEDIDMVWRVTLTGNLAVIAYQVQERTRLAIFNFAPNPQQIVMEMRSFKNSNQQLPRSPVHQLQQLPPNQAHQHQQQQSQSQQTQSSSYARFMMSIDTTDTLNHLPTPSNAINCTGHPLLVLGMASQSITENVIDLDTDQLMTDENTII